MSLPILILLSLWVGFASAKEKTDKRSVKSSSHCLVNHYSKDISNRLPVGFVKSLTNKGLWMTNFEQENSAFNIDLHNFINNLIDKAAPSPELFSQLVVKKETYPVKIEILRFFERQPDSCLAQFQTTKAIIQQTKELIFKKYFEMVLELVRMSGIVDFEPIMQEFRKRWTEKQIQIEDLTEDKRLEWAQASTTKNLHTYQTPELLEKNGLRYVVSGVYSERLKILAIDLSQPVEESLVTISHEIIHAADPELQKAREEIRADYQVVSQLLKEKLKSFNLEDKADLFLSALMQDIFFEMGRIDIVDFIREMRDKRLQLIEKELEGSALKQLRTNPYLARLLRNIIKVTVENEYKAYSFSLALYETLKSKFQMLAPSQNRNRVLEQHFNHKHSLQTTLSFAMNPFSKESALSEFRPVVSTKEAEMSIQALKAVFEAHYIEQTKKMMSETSVKYAAIYNILDRARSEALEEDSLPAWTRPGGFNSPTNPLQIVAAKISTAQVIRFKQNMDLFLKKMPELQEALLGMTAGMLDLHDISFGEMKLLGLQPKEARAENVLPTIFKVYAQDSHRKGMIEYLKRDLTDTPPDFLPYFSELNWDPRIQSEQGQITQAIPQPTMMENLYRLRLLKVVHWLRTELPIGKENVISIKAILAKLFEGHYDHEEITRERALELTKELESYLQAAEVSTDELKKIETYMTALSLVYFMATESKWQPVAAEFYQRLLQTRSAFENLGFNSRLSWQAITEDTRVSIANFKASVTEHFKSCAQSSKFEFYSSNQLFQLGPFQFPLTAMCVNYKLYIFRQPGDYNRAATTWAPYGVPETKIFMNTRPIRLEPFVSYK